MFDVVIVAYNSRSIITPCLEALAKQSLKPQTITLVDNSPEDSAEAICDGKEGVQVLRRPDNLGFAGGCNLGAAQGTADLVLFLNPDVILRADWLEVAAQLFLTIPDAAILGGKLFYPDGQVVQHAGGILYHPLATTAHRLNGAREPEEDEPDYVTGAAMAVRRRVFESLKGFDPDFHPVYYEDVDLCYRAKLAGWRVIYSPKLIGIHKESTSVDRTTLNYYFWTHQQRLKFVLKHYSTDQLLREFLPAEAARLRGDLSPVELEASLAAYRSVIGTEPQFANSGARTEPDWSRMLLELQEGWELKEGELRSQLPLIGPAVSAVRTAVNNLAPRWYMLQIMAQQREFNAAVFRLVRELARRERSAEGTYLMAVGILAHRLRRLEKKVEKLQSGEV